MTVDAFADRLARVRQRFVSTLEHKIEEAGAAVEKIADVTPDAAAAVGETYRCIHGIVGVGPTVGFPATGRAAHAVEDALRPAQRGKRGLTADELVLFRSRLETLREAAEREMQSFYSGAQ